MEYDSTPPPGAPPPLPHYNHPFCCYHQNPNPNPNLAYHLSQPPTNLDPSARFITRRRLRRTPTLPTEDVVCPTTPRGPHSASVLPLRRGLRRRRKSRRAAGWFLGELTGQYGSPPRWGTVLRSLQDLPMGLALWLLPQPYLHIGEPNLTRVAQRSAQRKPQRWYNQHIVRSARSIAPVKKTSTPTSKVRST
ncbi:putative zinc finger RNA-binding protein [Iris pallida]|uniref:Zinc finger RNA-binding protein n=1 Tax=Iris pallida TaxID=29817 RepID=A0AAX6IZ03_IRIPA|nr:putative zinc finger RNA-binding protein [Iris pallida]